MKDYLLVNDSDLYCQILYRCHWGLEKSLAKTLGINMGPKMLLSDTNYGTKFKSFGAWARFGSLGTS